MSVLSLIFVLITATLYVSFHLLNDWLFKAFELHSGANWVFLPAGLRLMCTLVFGIEGAIGLLIAGLLLAMNHLSQDPVTGIVTAMISAGAPYLVYVGALRIGMPSSLEKLSPALLSVLALLYALSNSALHSLWFVARGIYPDLLHNWITMFVGDLIGTLIMIYVLKMTMSLLRRRARQSL